jgi:CDP-diacylglycerol---serine O-phosphatidyltransferase
MLPAMANSAHRQQLVQLGAFVCFLFLLCGASRLARFNISHDPVPKNPGRPGRKYFVGMPIPAAAGVIAAVIHFFRGIPISISWVSFIWMALVGLIGFLMVSTWRFWSGKEINLTYRHPFQWMVLIGLVLYALVFFSQYVLILMALMYMFSGILARVAYSWRRARRLPLSSTSPTN